MKNDLPINLKISKIVEENPQVKTFYFKHKLNSKPGQFVMLWIPELDQKPFSVGYDDGQQFGLTIFARGPLTKKLFTLKIDDQVGITGPYGTNYSLKQDTHYILVAGGYGAAPLAYLAEQLANKDCTIDFCLGARTSDLLLFKKRINNINNCQLHLATDDGSVGKKGLVTDILEELLKQNKKYIIVGTCGPEMMEKKVLDICNKKNVDCEISIERHMKCGFGICGQCAVDDLGICMCTEGPVVKKELANKIKEFGLYHRDKSGKKINY